MTTEASPLRRVKINVGGKVFETTARTLQRIPLSKLAELTETSENYDDVRKEYFFDRNPFLFTSILDYYRTGELHFTHCVCPNQVRKELEFWDIEQIHLSECCQRWFQTADEYDYYSSMLKDWLEKMEGDEKLCDDMLQDRSQNKRARCTRFQIKVWRFFEYPNTSIPAKIWGIFYLLVVIASVTIQCGNTVKEFRIPLATPRRNVTSLDNPKMEMYLTTELLPWMWHVDSFCLVIFCVELVIRFISCPFKKKFFLSFFNIIDTLSTLNILIMYVFESLHPNYWEKDQLFLIVYVLSAFGVLRCMRLVKFAKQMNQGMKLLLLAIRASFREIFLLLVLIGIGTLIFSNLIYFAEFDTDNEFPSIPIGFWWSIVTMTTVGYGDKHPNSAWGYVVGALCAITGMLCTGLPIPIIANNFNVLYSYARRRKVVQSKEEERHKTIDTLNLYSAPSIANCNTGQEKQEDESIRNGNHIVCPKNKAHLPTARL